MKLGAFMDPEYPIFSTTLCYLERDDAYLMLHRVKKEDDYNHDKWIGVGGKFERFESPEDCLLREVKEGDKIFFRLLNGERPWFSLKLVYEGDTLRQAVLDGKRVV